MGRGLQSLFQPTEYKSDPLSHQLSVKHFKRGTQTAPFSFRSFCIVYNSNPRAFRLGRAATRLAFIFASKKQPAVIPHTLYKRSCSIAPHGILELLRAALTTVPSPTPSRLAIARQDRPSDRSR